VIANSTVYLVFILHNQIRIDKISMFFLQRLKLKIFRCKRVIFLILWSIQDLTVLAKIFDTLAEFCLLNVWVCIVHINGICDDRIGKHRSPNLQR